MRIHGVFVIYWEKITLKKTLFVLLPQYYYNWIGRSTWSTGSLLLKHHKSSFDKSEISNLYRRFYSTTTYNISFIVKQFFCRIMSHKQESIDFSSNATLPIDVHSLQSSSTGNLSTLGRDYNVTLNGSEYSASGPANSVGTCILFFILASCFCLCAKSNVPDERYRLYPNGVPPVKKKRKIDPEKRKKLIERSVITKVRTTRAWRKFLKRTYSAIVINFW